MATLTKVETQQIEDVVQMLITFRKQTDERIYGRGDDFSMRQIPPPDEHILRPARMVRELLHARGIPTPKLDNFLLDRSPFDSLSVIDELRKIETEVGEE